MGEPGGIGPEITVKAWQYLRETDCNPFFLIADPGCYNNFEIDIDIITDIKALTRTTKHAFRDALPVLDLGVTARAELGIASHQTAHAVIKAIETAVRACQQGFASAMVTNPIEKRALADSGFQFPGHTEFLGFLTQNAKYHTKDENKNSPLPNTRPIMMLAGPSLRTIPLTVHQSLISVSESLSTENLIEVVEIVVNSLKVDFDVPQPRIVIAGLNPHAGENGLFGSEETTIITPSVKQLSDKGINIRGPLPADTLFHETARATYDVAICMYHDQALIPVKTLDFDHTVNVTLGLPIIRTSPDHGTALDIAGKGLANPTSLIEAIKLAGRMAANRNRAHA